jgi:hypothetical protein
MGHTGISPAVLTGLHFSVVNFSVFLSSVRKSTLIAAAHVSSCIFAIVGKHRGSEFPKFRGGQRRILASGEWKRHDRVL